MADDPNLMANLATTISLVGVLAAQLGDQNARITVLETQLKRIEATPPPTSALSVDVERALGLYSQSIPRDVSSRMRRAVVLRKAQGDDDAKLLEYIRGGEQVPDTIGG